MGPIAIISGVACIAVFALNSATRPRTDAQLLSLALLASWGLYTFLSTLNPWPENVRLFALVDLAVGLTAWLCHRTQKRLYKRLLYWSIALQIVWHGVFWMGMRWADPALYGRIQYRYAYGLSVLGFAQIALGSWPGVSDVAGRLRRWVSGGPPGRHPLGAA